MLRDSKAQPRRPVKASRAPRPANLRIQYKRLFIGRPGLVANAWLLTSVRAIISAVRENATVRRARLGMGCMTWNCMAVADMRDRLVKIVSGGQTGVDRGALDAALTHGVACGGWCPKGRRSEDGVIPEKYALRETPGADYEERTRWNVRDSDGTVIVYFGVLAGGTEYTRRCCIDLARPHLLINGAQVAVEDAACRIGNFMEELPGAVVNVAGPRAGEEARAYQYTLSVISHVIAVHGG
jgi:hypothetical protein